MIKCLFIRIKKRRETPAEAIRPGLPVLDGYDRFSDSVTCLVSNERREDIFDVKQL